MFQKERKLASFEDELREQRKIVEQFRALSQCQQLRYKRGW